MTFSPPTNRDTRRIDRRGQRSSTMMRPAAWSPPTVGCARTVLAPLETVNERGGSTTPAVADPSASDPPTGPRPSTAQYWPAHAHHGHPDRPAQDPARSAVPGGLAPGPADELRRHDRPGGDRWRPP